MISNDRAVAITIAVFIVAFALLLPGLGDQIVWTKDEARTGLVARAMVRGDWLIPHIGGRVYFEKPPLFPWLVALLSSGPVTEWALRLPATLASAGTVAVTYAMAARLIGPAAGLTTAAILLASPSFFQWARIGRLEAMLTFWTTLAIWSFMRWLDGGRRTDALLAGLWMGLGFLTKGPVALLPLLAVAVVVGWRRTLTRRRLDLACAVGATALVPAVWLAAAAATAPDFRDYLSAAAPTVAHEIRGRPSRHVAYAVGALGVGFFPWSVLIPGVLLVLYRTRRTAGRRLALPIAWTAIMLLVFGVLVNSREVYFLPIYPALAILVGWAWHTASRRFGWTLMGPLAAVLAGVVGLGMTLMWSPRNISLHGQPLHVGVFTGLVLTAIALGMGGVAWTCVRAGRLTAAGLTSGFGVLAVLFFFESTARVPAVNAAYPTATLAARLAAQLPPEAEIAYLDRLHVTALLFYLPQRAIQLPTPEATATLRGRPATYLLLPEADLRVAVDAFGVPVRVIDRLAMDRGLYVLAAPDRHERATLSGGARDEDRAPRGERR